MGSPVSRPARAGLPLLLALALALPAAVLASAPAALAAPPAPTFERPTAEATFGLEVVYRQTFDSPVALARVEILLEYPASLGPFVVEVAGATPPGRREVVHRHVLATDGHLVPNTPITARWRLVPADRNQPPVLGPPTTVVYRDTRFAWRTLAGDLVRLHWYDGPDSFGRRALAIGEAAVREATAFLGVTETEPIDFFVYADQGALYDALGPATREHVGGQAHSDIRTMFALIGPGEVADPWVSIVIPHELAHLVFDTAARNPYNFPPRWLNEGVAVYLSEGFTARDRASVEAAAGAGRLMPLRALGGQFPTTEDRFRLAYSQGVSAVDFLVREHGERALVGLIRSYAGGVTDDEAFEAAIGLNLTEFEAAWLDHLGAPAPIAYGPRPAPAGPLPPDWLAGATPGSVAPDAPSPTPTPAPEPLPGGDGAGWPLEEPLTIFLMAAAGAAVGLLVGGGIALLRRRRSGSAGPS
jgi:hypothetical protein